MIMYGTNYLQNKYNKEIIQKYNKNKNVQEIKILCNEPFCHMLLR